LEARLAFDAIAGSMTARLLNALPVDGRVVVYGGLAYEPMSLDTGDVIFNQRRVEGFYLTHWIAHQRPLALLSMQRQLYRLGNVTRTAIQLRAPLGDVQQAIATYEAGMSAGKVLLVHGLS
jgi:NADPH:quinone reductase-like Zn-dependent oxidoreductase